MEEQLLYTEKVGSSTLSSRTTYMIFTPLEEAQQKIVTFGLLAQLVEQVTLNHFVGGSNPSQSTIIK